MFRFILATMLASLATSAIAHPGHIESVAGHSHYVVAGALAIAAAIAVQAFRKIKASRNV